MQHSVTREINWRSLRSGKKIYFQSADVLQIIVHCWFLKQKHLKQHCRLLGFLLLFFGLGWGVLLLLFCFVCVCALYKVVIKKNNNEISCLKMLTFTVLNERNVVHSGPCPPSKLWCCLS